MAAENQSTRRRSKESPDLNELLTLELQEIHSAESQLARVLPRLAKAVQSDKLRPMLELRQEQGERLLSELESTLEEMEESPGRKKNVAAEGLINDAREHVQELEAGPALDAVLIGALQKTEHYCIAAWGTARSMAAAAGQKAAVKSMERALKEGKALDEQLTQLAEAEVTPALSSADSEEEDEGAQGTSGSRKRSGSERRVST